MLAASRGHVDMTSFLVSARADVNAADSCQRTTLHMVVWWHGACFQFIVVATAATTSITDAFGQFTASLCNRKLFIIVGAGLFTHVMNCAI